MKLSSLVLSVITMAVVNPGLFAQSMFPAGASNKAVGMASAVQSKGAVGVLYNPASIYSQRSLGHTPYLELGAGSMTQSYEHRDFDPVKISVRTPLAVVGAHGPLVVDGLAYGVMLSPTGYGQQSVDGLPRRITGLYEPLYVENKSESYDLGLGLGWRVPQTPWQIGASVIRRHEHRKILATQVGEDVTLVKLNARNDFYLPVVGVTFQPGPWFDAGLSYTFPKKKHYKGSQKAATSEETTAPKVTNYDPAIWRLGARAEVSNIIGMLNLSYLQWSRGKNVIREGLTSSTNKSDLRDIWQVAVSAGYRFTPRLHSLVSYAVLPSPWGEGVYREGDGEQKIGVDIGQADNVHRRVMAAGLFADLDNGWQFDLGMMRSYGERELSGDADKPGFYQNEVAVLTLGTAKSF